VEVVYEREPASATVNPALYAGVDIGLNNLAVLTSNKVGFVPRLVTGRPVKSINQFYNKRRAELQRQVSAAGMRGTSQRLERITTKRTRRIDWYLHTASRRIINLLMAEGIATLCIGKNPLWKQNANMGRRNNQTFVAVPHARFIEMLTYMAALVGIQVRVTEESYTSKASFLDADPLPIFDPTQPAPIFSGRRVKRGLYRAADGRHINADANGAYTVIRKVAPDAFAQESRGCVVHPIRLAV
jgi:putative transposase